MVNPFFNSGLTATNKQILYGLKTLDKYKKIDNTLVNNKLNYQGHQGIIVFCTEAEKAIDSLITGFKIIEKNREGRNLKDA